MGCGELLRGSEGVPGGGNGTPSSNDSFVKIYRNGRRLPPADRAKFDAPVLVDRESDIGESTDPSQGNPAVVKFMLALAKAMREDFGEADLTRPTKPVLE